MKRLLSILIICTLWTALYAQSYRMVVTSTPEKKETNPVSLTPSSQYDSLLNIRPYDNESYYRQFIGQSIIFYPRHPHSKSLPEYFANFETPQSQAVGMDTTWLRKRANPKPKDYQLKEILSYQYKPQYVDDKEVTLCGASQPAARILPFHYYQENKNKERNTYRGYYTSYHDIEGKSFKITDIKHSANYQEPTIFTLLDENGNTVYWRAHAGNFDYEPFSISQNNQYYPVIVTGFMKKMEQLYLNKEFYIKDFQPITKYKCIDIVYSGKEDNYMVPSFVLKNDSAELTIPFTQAPEIFSYKIDPSNPLSNEPYFSQLEILDNKAYADLIEKERIAKAEKLEKERIDQADKLEKERMAKAQAERARAEALQKRTQYLNKKFGTAMAKIILSGKVQIGMTREMCKEAWGHPQKVNTTTTPQTVSEQWVYGGHNYLYFTNGRLTAVQN